MANQKRNDKMKARLDLPERVDSFNFEGFVAEIETRLASAKEPVTLNMNDTRFISLPFIKKLAQMAHNERSAGRVLRLLNPSEKVKKQIGIFADLNLFEIERRPSMRGWPELGGSADF